MNGYAYYSVGLTLAVILVITVITLTSYYCSRSSVQNRQVAATANLELNSALTIQIRQDEALVNNYPVLLYSEAKQHKPDSSPIAPSCSICLADYKDTDWLRLLPDCGHLFHKDCVDKWLRLNLSCPVCRTSPLPTPLSTPLAEVTPLATRHDWAWRLCSLSNTFQGYLKQPRISTGLMAVGWNSVEWGCIIGLQYRTYRKKHVIFILTMFFLLEQKFGRV